MDSSAIIDIREISKTFIPNPLSSKKRINALDKISLSVESGSIFGLLGQNGAGKTTLIKLLLGMLFPSSGSYSLFGKEPDFRLRENIGFLPENPKFPAYLKGKDALRIFGQLSGISGHELDKRISDLSDAMHISEALARPVRTYSKGMLQRLGLIQAMLHEPELLILDEPTDGVDPVGRKEIRDILLDYKKRGKTIFINSHILSEVELITDRVAILNKGRLIYNDNIKGLSLSQMEFLISVDELNADSLNSVLRSFPFCAAAEGGVSCRVNNINRLNEVIDRIRAEGMLIKEVRQAKQSLEEIYLSAISGDRHE